MISHCMFNKTQTYFYFLFDTFDRYQDMKKRKEGFIRNRIRSVGFSFRGIKILLRSEKSIQIQVLVALLATIIGLLFKLSVFEWMAQFGAIGLVLVAESLNTAIEKISDFVHPNFNEKIREIKDIAAGSCGIAAIISLIVGGLIYIPKVLMLF